VLKLEISYRVIISWTILVSFREFFEDYIFALRNIWVFIISSFALRYLLINVNGKATMWHTPCFALHCIAVHAPSCWKWKCLLIHQWVSNCAHHGKSKTTSPSKAKKGQYFVIIRWVRLLEPQYSMFFRWKKGYVQLSNHLFYLGLY